jgi:hypothetical protein
VTATTITSPAATALTIQSAASTAVTIDTSQNVGIGTASPNGRLDVTSSVAVASITSSSTTAGNQPTLRFQHSGNNTYQIKGGSNLQFLSDDGTNERMRIDTSGNFLINTTSTTLYSATSGYGVCYRVNASFDVLSTSDNAIILNRTGTDGSIEEFRKSGTIVGSISVTGSATAYNTSSDYRLKENVQPMSNGLATVSALKPVRYDWVSDKSAGEGFIAHELQAVIPQAVTGEKDAVDEEGNIKPQGVDYSKIVVHLVAAIQELKADLDAAKAEIATLKGAA